jgi:archaellum component FlaC
MLLIGIIIGSVAGYFGNYLITKPILDDFQDRLYTLEEEYDTLQSNYNNLTTDYNDLEAQLETLQGAYSMLQSQKTSLDEEYQALTEQLEILEALYESLLEDYQTSLGGLDFSNQTIQVIERNYTWTYDHQTYSLNIVVPEPMYEYYSTKERYETSDYRGYILHPYDDAYIEVLIKEFDKIAAMNNLTAVEEMEIVASFVQNLHYLTDDTTGYDEYPKFPVEILVDGGGDCEDTSILLSHLLEALDIDTALLTLPGHMAVGVEVNATGAHWDVGNSTYYYLETTMAGWSIGSIPIEHVGKSVKVDEVTEIPFLSHTWDATRTNQMVTATITYTNDSPVNGTGYKAFIGIELDTGEIWSETIGDELDLGFGESMTVTMVTEGPRHDTMRLVVGVWTPDGEIITKKYSTYFTTR